MLSQMLDSATQLTRQTSTVVGLVGLLKTHTQGKGAVLAVETHGKGGVFAKKGSGSTSQKSVSLPVETLTDPLHLGREALAVRTPGRVELHQHLCSSNARQRRCLQPWRQRKHTRQRRCLREGSGNARQRRCLRQRQQKRKAKAVSHVDHAARVRVGGDQPGQRFCDRAVDLRYVCETARKGISLWRKCVSLWRNGSGSASERHRWKGWWHSQSSRKPVVGGPIW